MLPVLFITQSKSRLAKPLYNKPQFFTIADYVYSVWDSIGVIIMGSSAITCEQRLACGSNIAFPAIIRSDFLVPQCDVRIGFMYIHLV